MQALAERVLKHIQNHELLKPGDRLGIAVSGGIDSVALLRLVAELRGELGVVVSVVHFNHKLRHAESDEDQDFVSQLARQLGLAIHLSGADVALHARDERMSIEAAARELRYAFFGSLLGEDAKLDRIATGHTLDDQAETVLMRLIRGSGMRGLGAIYPRLQIENDDGEPAGEIVRPLLAFRRRELEEYLLQIGQSWREDKTNAESKYTRNRLRKTLMPLLEREFNPSIKQCLSELAEIARGEQDYWDNEISGWMGTAVHWSEPNWARNAREPQPLVQIALPTAASNQSNVDLRRRIDSAEWLVMNASLDRLWFLSEPVAVQRRLLKAVAEEAGIPLEFKHVEEILGFVAAGKSAKELSLPLGWIMQSTHYELIFVTPDLRTGGDPGDYEYEIPVPGKAVVPEIGSVFEILLVDSLSEDAPDQFLDAGSLSKNLCVRNWRAGDRFWPAHRKEPKKVKEWLQDLHVEHSQRKLWPVLASSDEIVWLRGFPAPAKFAAQTGGRAVLIRERPLSEPSST